MIEIRRIFTQVEEIRHEFGPIAPRSSGVARSVPC